MSEKVKLPRGVAEAIETLRSMDFKLTNWDIVYAFANSQSGKYPALIEFANKDFDTFIKSLFNGYEIEETPEDKVRDYHEHQNGPARNVIETTLNILNIKIEGVNDHEA